METGKSNISGNIFEHLASGDIHINGGSNLVFNDNSINFLDNESIVFLNIGEVEIVDNYFGIHSKKEAIHYCNESSEKIKFQFMKN